jgi:hypothetical protein
MWKGAEGKTGEKTTQYIDIEDLDVRGQSHVTRSVTITPLRFNLKIL